MFCCRMRVVLQEEAQAWISLVRWWEQVDLFIYFIFLQKGQEAELGCTSDQEKSKQRRGTHPKQQRPRQTGEDRASGRRGGVRKSSHKRPKDDSQPEQQRMMDRWRKLHCFLCHPTLFCFLSAGSMHTLRYLLLHCTALRGQVAVLIAWGEYGGHRES